jgi:hypothetical protein
MAHHQHGHHRRRRDFLGYYKALGINLEEASECDECAAAARSVVAAGCSLKAMVTHHSDYLVWMRFGAAVCLQWCLGMLTDAATEKDA